MAVDTGRVVWSALFIALVLVLVWSALFILLVLVWSAVPCTGACPGPGLVWSGLTLWAAAPLISARGS